MKKLGRKRKHPSKDITSKNRASSTSIKITCTSSSDPTIAPGLHDIILMVDDGSDIYSFWLQIKK